jgi:nucleotide-binding universal stress UspA family protein
MNSPAPATGDLYLVVGYDGSEPATRALDGAVRLLSGREGSIEVVYVPHMPSVDMLSADAIVGMETAFDEVTTSVHEQASEQLRGREERWRFERARDEYRDIPDVLIGVAGKLGEEHPGGTVVIVVGSSSQARHRVLGSVAVSLARHSPVPLVIVP